MNFEKNRMKKKLKDHVTLKTGVMAAEISALPSHDQNAFYNIGK